MERFSTSSRVLNTNTFTPAAAAGISHDFTCLHRKAAYVVAEPNATRETAPRNKRLVRYEPTERQFNQHTVHLQCSKHTLLEFSIVAAVDAAAAQHWRQGEHAVGTLERRAQLSDVRRVSLDQLGALLREPLGHCERQVSSW